MRYGSFCKLEMFYRKSCLSHLDMTHTEKDRRIRQIGGAIADAKWALTVTSVLNWSLLPTMGDHSLVMIDHSPMIHDLSPMTINSLAVWI